MGRTWWDGRGFGWLPLHLRFRTGLEFSVKEDVELPGGWRVEVAPATESERMNREFVGA